MLDIRDFALDGVVSGPHLKKWAEVRDKFDYNGDGQVSPEEVSGRATLVRISGTDKYI